MSKREIEEMKKREQEQAAAQVTLSLNRYLYQSMVLRIVFRFRSSKNSSPHSKKHRPTKLIKRGSKRVPTMRAEDVSAHSRTGRREKSSAESFCQYCR